MLEPDGSRTNAQVPYQVAFLFFLTSRNNNPGLVILWILWPRVVSLELVAKSFGIGQAGKVLNFGIG